VRDADGIQRKGAKKQKHLNHGRGRATKIFKESQFLRKRTDLYQGTWLQNLVGAAVVINTWLQPGGWQQLRTSTALAVSLRTREAVKTAGLCWLIACTRLKPGVNENHEGQKGRNSSFFL